MIVAGGATAADASPLVLQPMTFGTLAAASMEFNARADDGWESTAAGHVTPFAAAGTSFGILAAAQHWFSCCIVHLACTMAALIQCLADVGGWDCG